MVFDAGSASTIIPKWALLRVQIRKLVAASAYILTSAICIFLHSLLCWLHIHIFLLASAPPHACSFMLAAHPTVIPASVPGMVDGAGKTHSSHPAFSLILATHQTLISAFDPHILFCISYTCVLQCWLSNPTLLPVL